MTKIKYGILGCGGHALDGHAIPGQKIKGLELVALCDVNTGNMSKFEKTLGKKFPKFTNRDKFFDEGDMEAVLIATPDEFHMANLSEAIEAKLHTIIEKPLAVNSGELETMQKLLQQAKEGGIVVTSCHPRRFDPPFVYVKEHLPEWTKKYGKVLKIDFDFSYHRSSKEWKSDRSLLLDHANHEIDLVNWLAGPSDFDASRLADGPDYYHVTGKRQDGIAFDFLGSRRLSSDIFQEQLRVRFERGEIVLDAHSGRLSRYNHETGKVKRKEIDPTDYALRGRKVMKNFVASIRDVKVQPYLSMQDLYVNTATAVMLRENSSWSYRSQKV